MTRPIRPLCIRWPDITRVAFLKPLVQSPKIEVGEYTYYDSPEAPADFEREAVLYAYGPERLIIGRFCAIAAGVRFLMPGASLRWPLARTRRVSVRR